MDIPTILSLIEWLIGQEPKIQAALQSIFSNPNPTPKDWQLLRDSIAAETYEQLVPDTQLPQTTPPPPTTTPPAAA